MLMSRSPQQPVEIILERATLYHGSATPGITELDRAQEDTVGAGVYLAEEATARAYAFHRARGTGTPVLYQVEIDRARLVDLTDQNAVTKVMAGFLPTLRAELARAAAVGDPWHTIESLRRTIVEVDGDHGVQATNLKAVTQHSGELFTSYLHGRGFDGLVALEGGEGRIGNHRTYLLFDPARLRIESEHQLPAGIATSTEPSAAYPNRDPLADTFPLDTPAAVPKTAQSGRSPLPAAAHDPAHRRTPQPFLDADRPRRLFERQGAPTDHGDVISPSLRERIEARLRQEGEGAQQRRGQDPTGPVAGHLGLHM
jgi:hypothetical protein